MIDRLTLDNLTDPNTLIGAVFYALLLAILASILSRVARLLRKRMINQNQRLAADQTAVVFISQLIQVAFSILAAAIYFYLIPALRAVGTAILATAGLVLWSLRLRNR